MSASIFPEAFFEPAAQSIATRSLIAFRGSCGRCDQQDDLKLNPSNHLLTPAADVASRRVDVSHSHLRHVAASRTERGAMQQASRPSRNHTAITRQSHGHVWQSHGNHMAITWQSTRHHARLLGLPGQAPPTERESAAQLGLTHPDSTLAPLPESAAGVACIQVQCMHPGPMHASRSNARTDSCCSPWLW